MLDYFTGWKRSEIPLTSKTLKCCVSAIFQGPGARNLECYFLNCPKAETLQLEALGNSFLGKRYCNESSGGINPTWIGENKIKIKCCKTHYQPMNFVSEGRIIL